MIGNDLTFLNYGGRVVVVGNRGTVEINPRDLMGREACIMGVALMKSSREDINAVTQALHSGIAKGFINPKVGHVFNLEDAKLAHDEVIDHLTGTRGKVILVTK